MSSISITPVSFDGAVASASNNGSTPQPPAAPVQSHKDTVKLSQGAQVIDLYRSGKSVSSISSELGVSKSIVNSYLGLIEETAVSTAGASVGGAAGGGAQTSSSTGSTSSSPTPEAIQAAAAVIQSATFQADTTQSASSAPETRISVSA